MEEWKEYKYTELAEIIGGGTPKTSVKEYWDGDIPWLSVKDFGNGDKYVYSSEKTITASGLNNSSTKLLNKHDIIISARGTVGEMAMIPFDMAFNQSCFGIRAKEVIDSDYLYYLTKTKIRELQNNSHGCVFDTITKNTFDNILCFIPSKDLQIYIASILSSLDDKIELNRRINDNLEQQAQALFKSWFVDFEPFKDGNFVDSELGMIPEGWRIGLFTEILSIKSGGTPKTDILEYWGDKIPFFTPKDVASTYCMETEKHISYKGLDNCNSLLYPINTTFITARGTVGKICLAGKEMAMNQSCYALVAKELYNNLFVYLSARLLIRKICTKANGAVFSAITVRDFDESIIIPDCSTLKDFNQKVSTIYNLIHGNNLETECIILIRDKLLPKLMSGELKIN